MSEDLPLFIEECEVATLKDVTWDIIRICIQINEVESIKYRQKKVTHFVDDILQVRKTHVKTHCTMYMYKKNCCV